jgi:hypothetical protein
MIIELAVFNLTKAGGETNDEMSISRRPMHAEPPRATAFRLPLVLGGTPPDLHLGLLEGSLLAPDRFKSVVGCQLRDIELSKFSSTAPP